MSEINRRDFLRSTAVAGLGGFLVLETFGACRPSDPALLPDSGPRPDGGPPRPDGLLPPDGTPGLPPLEDVYAKFPVEFTEKTVPTTCWIGKQDCGMLARVITQTIDGKSYDRIVKLEGHPDHPLNLGTLCPKGTAQLQAIYDYNRVKWPLRRINPKGQPGRFAKISWAEALTELKAQLDDAKAKKKPVLWQKGRSKAKSFYDEAFVKALGAAGITVASHGHGSYCSDSGYRAAEYTIGYHGVLMPDFGHTRYLLSWGWGMTTSGGNKYCWLTWPQKFLAAREAGLLKRVVCLDPNRRQTGHFADEWLPNRPGSDLAFFLGIAHYLAHNKATGYDSGLIDQEYLKGHTNAASLVLPDGTLLRVGGKEQVWDLSSGSLKDFDTAGVDPALTGKYVYNDGVQDVEVMPAFEAYKAHLAPYSPDWADQTCGLPALTTARVARELFENAHIGETITVQGQVLPYRPVGVMAYHVSQQELGFSAIRACINVFQLLGAVDVPGGMFIDTAPSELYKNWDKLDNISIKTSGLSYSLKDSKFFPINSGCPSFFHRAQLDPERYDVNEATIPRKAILHMVDPVGSFTDTPIIKQAYAQFEHVTAISPWLSETADLFADLILPAATLEKYEGPSSGKTMEVDAKALRLPPVKPLWESRGEIDMYLDIAEANGFLTDYLKEVNSGLKLVNNVLPTDKKPAVRDIFDAWAKEQKLSGIDYFEQKGVTAAKPNDVTKIYTRAKNYYGARHRLYGESLLGYRKKMIAAKVGEIYYQDYTVFPTWRPPTMWASVKDGYAYHLLSHKQIEFKQSRASFVPVLAELAPRQGLYINPIAAQALGIAEGDEIWVESHNAVTGETRRLKTRAVLFGAIRPDTVSMSHHYGLSVTPTSKGQGPSPNFLYFAGEGYIQCTQDASFHVMVKISRA